MERIYKKQNVIKPNHTILDDDGDACVYMQRVSQPDANFLLGIPFLEPGIMRKTPECHTKTIP